MRLIIREKKELLDIEDCELRQELDFGFFLFEFLAFDFSKFMLKQREKKENTIRTFNNFYVTAIEISELFFYLLWQEIEHEYQGEDEVPISNDVIGIIEDFSWAFEGRNEPEDCSRKQSSALKEAYTAAIDQFIAAQEIFSFVCKFCLDVDYDEYPLEGLSARQKWYILSKSVEFPDPLEFVEQFTKFSEETSIVEPGELFYSDSLLHMDTGELEQYAGEPLTLPEAIMKYRNAELEPLKIIHTDSILGLMYAEFWSMVTNSSRIKKCQLCGKYFIPFSENSEYCSRIYKDKGKSCKDYAPMVIHRRKIQRDELLSVYTKAKNARYMRHRRNPELYTMEKLDAWLVEAKAVLGQAQSGEMSAEELKEMLLK